jgi:1,6-anhydro-N-acetylmuramate kinase
MYYIGLMSGTSMDAVDAALVEFDKKATLKYVKSMRKVI